MNQFWDELAEWSQATFGVDGGSNPLPPARGPLGPLKHLHKEVEEAISELSQATVDQEALEEEITDCLFLVFDAARRAGMTYAGLRVRATRKLLKNRQRRWQVTQADEPIEHIRDEGA